MQLSIATGSGVVYTENINSDGVAPASSSPSAASNGSSYQDVAAEVNAAVQAAVSNVPSGNTTSTSTTSSEGTSLFTPTVNIPSSTGTTGANLSTSSNMSPQGILALNSLTAAVSQAKNNLSSSGRTLASIFKEASDTYGVDQKLLESMAFCESDFNPNEKSSAGAMGIMQLMPSTAKGLGITDPYDPYQNIMGGAKLISEFISKYKDVGVALAAYNAGYGRVDAAGGQIPDIDSVKAYVEKVQRFAESGVTVPDVKYGTDNSSKVAAAEKLEKLLAEYSKHESYGDFVNAFTAELTKEATSSSDATSVYTSYEKLLSSAGKAITSVMKNIKES